MKLDHLHEWNVTPREAVALQERLRGSVVADRPVDIDAVRLVAGVDVSVKRGRSRAAVAILSFPDLLPLEYVTAEQDTPFPYVPGLLSFREGPVLVEAFERLREVPDVFLFDGMGIAHPRRLGIASHLGLWLGRPTVGCGKTRLVGNADEPASEKGSTSPLTHQGERIGTLLRTRTGIAPVYVSPGHLCDVASASALVMAATGRYRLPEPIRAAHRIAGDFIPPSPTEPMPPRLL